jgi:hypothetical protein
MVTPLWKLYALLAAAATSSVMTEQIPEKSSKPAPKMGDAAAACLQIMNCKRDKLMRKMLDAFSASQIAAVIKQRSAPNAWQAPPFSWCRAVSSCQLARSPAADFEIEMGACNIRYGKHTVQTLQMY